MLDLATILPGAKTTTLNGWLRFNAVCCHHRGHRPDTRGRAGLISNADRQTYSCFNCGFKATVKRGMSLSRTARLLMKYSGLSETEIQRVNLALLRDRDDGTIEAMISRYQIPTFKNRELPTDAELIDPENSEHDVYRQYLASRGFQITDYPFMCRPTAKTRDRDSVLIPFSYRNQIIGYSQRFYDQDKPKYITHSQLGYVFGMDLQKPNYAQCIVVEGIFDALALNACAVLTANISDSQAALLNTVYKPKIYVPDRDKTGMQVVDRALELGYRVSIPEWHESCKDVADAVKRYGRVDTLLSILQTATDSRIKLNILRKRYK